MKVWTAKEVNPFLQAARGSKFCPAFYLAITTGMRIGELLGLKWSDVDLDREVISIRRILSEGLKLVGETKTAKSRRRISISPSTVEVRRKHRIKQKEEYSDTNTATLYLPAGTENRSNRVIFGGFCYHNQEKQGSHRSDFTIWGALTPLSCFSRGYILRSCRND